MRGLWIGDAYAHGPGECEPEYASLWDGLVGCWVPQMGPTGNTLLDLSGYGNHGTLTNMDPATDWISAQDGWALDFDGINDYAVTGAATTVDTGAFTITVRAYVAAIPVDRSVVAGPIYRPSILLGYQAGQWNLYMAAYPTGTAADTQIAATAKAWQTVSYAFVKATSVLGMKDGALLVDTAATSTRSDIQWPRYMGSSSTPGGFAPIQLAGHIIHSRALSVSEISMLHADPLCFLRPRRRWWAVAPTAGRRRLRRYHERLYMPGLNPGVM